MDRRHARTLMTAALLAMIALAGSAYYWVEMDGRAARLAASADPALRLAAVHMLWDRRGGRALKILSGLGGDAHTPVAVAAIRAMGQRGGPVVGDVLRGIIDRDGRADVRAEAAAALGNCPGALDDLLKLLTVPAAQVRAGAAKGLAGARNRRAVEPLMKAMEDPDRQVRVWAATALARTVHMPFEFQAEAPDEARRGQLAALRAALASVALAEKDPSEGNRPPPEQTASE